MKRCKGLCLVIGLFLLFGMFGGLSASAFTYAELGGVMVKLNQDCVDVSLMQLGDITRMANVMRRAQNGEEITIGFIGGSITYGSGMIDNDGTNMDRFSEHVQAWFREKFPNAVCNLVNAGLPATGSLIGTFRAPTDLFAAKPDLVVIEYAVNEGADHSSQESTEALIRNAFALENDPAVMLLFMATKGGNGWNSQDGKAELGRYYDLPMISWADGVRRAFALGLATPDDFDADGTHPNKNGHAAVSQFIINYLEQVYASLDTAPTETPAVPEPLYSDDLRYVKALSSANFAPSSLGSFLISDNACMYEQFKQGWTVNGGSEPFVFECEAKRVYIPYQRSTSSNGVVQVTVNGVPVKLLEAKAASYNQLGAALVFESDTTKKVTVELKLVSGSSFQLSGIWLAY